MSDPSLSPSELAALLNRLDALIAEARTLQQDIAARLRDSRRRDQPVRGRQPDRRRRPRSKDA